MNIVRATRNPQTKHLVTIIVVVIFEMISGRAYSTGLNLLNPNLRGRCGDEYSPILAKIDKSPNSNRETSLSSPWFEVTGNASYYLHYIFHADPRLLFLSMCDSFFGLAFIFLILIVIAGIHSPDCVGGNGQPFSSYGAAFGDGFSLPWVTLR
jgi:hypothetical protein